MSATTATSIFVTAQDGLRLHVRSHVRSHGSGSREAARAVARRTERPVIREPAGLVERDQ